MTTPTSSEKAEQDPKTHQATSRYWRFFAMIATAMVVMFALMYVNTFEFDHLKWKGRPAPRAG